MKKYKLVLYPNVNSYKTKVEANSIDEAIEIAEDEASRNCYFMAEPSEIECIEEEE